MENDTQTSGAPSIGKTVVWLIVLLLVVGGFYWYGGKTEPQESIKIGGAFGLTGICAEFGEGELKAVTLAIEEANASGGVNGKRLELVSEDTQCENKTTVNAFQKLISIDNVSAIIGPTWGDSFQGGYPLAQAANIISISPSTAIEALEISKQPISLIFSTWFPARTETTALQEYVFSQGVRRIAIVHDQDPFGIMSAEVFKERAAQNDIEVVDEQEVAVETTDFRTIISKLKLKSFDAIFSSFITPESKAIFIQQLREQGIPVPVLSTADIQNPALLASFSKALEGVIYTYPKGAGGYDAFAKKYKEKFGTEPEGPSASNAYDAVTVFVAAMKKGSVAGKELERALLETSIPGVTYDRLKFSDKHQVVGGEFEVKTVKDGKFVNVK
jgi:branched-chain amino acid transport system substrate-binding protein